MGSGWHEWPLIIFTVLGQCVVGGFIVLALALIKGDLTREQQQRVVRSMFGLWVLMGVGFIASTLHLGSPMRAFNSLNRVGASSLSNEIASGALFFAVGGIGWLLAVVNKLPAGLRHLWLVITMVLGIIFVWMMVRVYNTIDTVPTVHGLDATELLPDDVYRRSAAGISAAALCGRQRLGDAPAAGGDSAGAGGERDRGADAGSGADNNP